MRTRSTIDAAIGRCGALARAGRNLSLVLPGVLLALAGCGGGTDRAVPRIYSLPVKVAALSDGSTAYLVIDPGEDEAFPGPLTGRLDIYPPAGADPELFKPKHFDLTGDESDSHRVNLQADALSRDGTDTTYTLTGEHEADGDMRLDLASTDPAVPIEVVPLIFQEPRSAEVTDLDSGARRDGISTHTGKSVHGPYQDPATQQFEFTTPPQGSLILPTTRSCTTRAEWVQWPSFLPFPSFLSPQVLDFGDRHRDDHPCQAYISWWNGKDWAWVDHWVDGDVKVKYDIYRKPGEPFDLRNAELIYIRPDGIEVTARGPDKPGYYRATSYSVDRSYLLDN